MRTEKKTLRTTIISCGQTHLSFSGVNQVHGIFVAILIKNDASNPEPILLFVLCQSFVAAAQVSCLQMGQSLSKKRRSLDHVSDSVHVQLKREKHVAIQHGKHPPYGFVERSPFPSQRSGVVCCEEEEEEENDLFSPSQDLRDSQQ